MRRPPGEAALSEVLLEELEAPTLPLGTLGTRIGALHTPSPHPILLISHYHPSRPTPFHILFFIHLLSLRGLECSKRTGVQLRFIRVYPTRLL